MKQLRLFIAEKIIDFGFSLMPEGKEKTLMAESLIQYTTIIEHDLRKEQIDKAK